MIVSHVRHGRTIRDARNLAAHLQSCRGNDHVEVLSIVGLTGTTLDAALAGMRRLASRRGAAAFHHISLSPTTTCTAADLRADADRVLVEMGADPGSHPHVLVIHEKSSSAERAERHGHLVLAHWGLDGTALNDGWLHLRLERVAREIEHDRGDPLTAGRHDRSLATALRARGRPEVAAALEALKAGEAPRSAVTAGARARLKRAGVSDVDVRVTVRQAWADCPDPEMFRAALAARDLRVVPGQRPGALVVETAGGIQVGALDRIVGERRADVAKRMEDIDGRGVERAVTPVRGAALAGNATADPGHRRADPAPHASVAAPGGVRRPVPVGEPAAAPRRHPGGDAQGVPRDGRGRDAGPGPVGPTAPSLAPRLLDLLTAQVLRRDLRPDTLHAAAVEHARTARVAELRTAFEEAREARDQDHEPVPPSDELTVARARAEAAEQRAKDQRETLKLAEVRHSDVMKAEPQGWRRWRARLDGGLARFEVDRADASAGLKTAQDYRRARDYIAKGMAETLRRQERAEEARQAEVETVQREARVTAAMRMVQARIAARIVRETDDAPFLSLAALFARAEVERSRQAAQRLAGDHVPDEQATAQAWRP